MSYMSDKDELRKAIESVKTEQAQHQADAIEEAEARKYKTSNAAAIEKFVRETLPGVAEPLLPQVGTMYGKLVNALAATPATSSMATITTGTTPLR